MILGKQASKPTRQSVNRIALTCIITLSLLWLVAPVASAYYYPPGHVPPGVPPNYNQIDTSHFTGVPLLPLPPPDSGGVYVYYDQGKWVIASHIYSKGNSLEQFHGSVLVLMDSPPQLNVNVFSVDFELWDDTTASKCLLQNDRWGWVQHDSGLYEIWWDVTTKEWKKGVGDVNDFMEIVIGGCAIDFNLWSSGHGGPFGPDQVYLGGSATRLSDVVGYTDTAGVFVNSPFVDTYVGISDPYQSQAGSDPANDPNSTIFTSKALPGASYNAFGLISSSDSYVCDPAYGSRYDSVFAYEGNGIQFAANCIIDTNTPPVLVITGDTTLFLCAPTEVCVQLHGDDDDGDDLHVSKITGAGTFPMTSSSSPLDTTHCFTPDTSGVYCFVFELDDDLVLNGVIEDDDDVDTICITIILNEPPVITCPPDTAVQCAADVPSCDPNNAVATDDSGPVIITCASSDNGGSGTIANPLIVTQTYTAVDTCGDSSQCQRIITVIDDTAPYFDQACPTSITAECDNVPTPATLTASDNCDNSPIVVFYADTTAGSCSNNFSINRHWVATDVSGNADTCTQTITVVDTTPPLFVEACPNDTTVECDAIPTVATLTATDNCDASPIVTFSESSLPGACPQEMVLTRTWIAADACGNADTCTQTITVVDTTPPIFTFTCPNDTTVECDAIPTAATLTATDNCDSSPIVSFSESSLPGSCPQEMIITRTWIAADACGNADTCTQTITVVDTTPPLFVEACPSDTTVECDAIPTAATLTATDNCDSAPIVSFSESSLPGACPQEMVLTRTWIVADACGNADTCTQTITVVDTTPPLFVEACPNDTTVECDAIPTAATLTATDNCDASPIVTFSESSLPGACPQEMVLTRTWIVADACGNADTCTQTITVVDTTPPIFTFTCPNDTTIECNSPIPEINNVPPQAVDNCDLNVDVVFTSDTIPGACPQSLIITNTWVATDDCGNSTTCSYVITIVDTTPPSFVEPCPNDTTVECDAVPSPATLTATDVCDANPSVSLTEDTTFLACGFMLTRTWTASDSCGNATTCQQTVTVIDTTAPICVSPNDTTVECTAIPPVGSATASDNCDPNPQITYLGETEVPGSCAGQTTLIRSWEAADNCGNADTCTQTITVIDTTPPICSVPSDTSILLCDSATVCLPVSGFDSCSGSASITILSGPGTLSGGMWCYLANSNETVSVTIQCTDACGNSSQKTFSVTFTVNAAPILTINDDSIRVCNAGDTVCVKMDVLDPDNGLHYDPPTIGWIVKADTLACFAVDDTSGLYCNTVIVYDSCGLSDTTSYCVDVTVCDTVLLAPNTTIEHGFSCTSVSGCFDPPAVLAGCGPFSWTLNGSAFDPANQVCYNLPSGAETTLIFDFVATDTACLRSATSTVTVHGVINSPPSLWIDTLTLQTICAGDTICFNYNPSDIDSNIILEELVPGMPNIDTAANRICFVPDSSGTYVFTVKVTDSCDLIAMASTSIHVDIIPPVKISDVSVSYFICGCISVCAPRPVELAGTAISWTVIGGSLVGDSICIQVCNSGIDTVLVIAEDVCGNVDTGTVVFNITANAPPSLTLSSPDTSIVCNFPATICSIIDNLSDTDNNLVDVTSSIGTVNTGIGSICFEATEPGTYCNRVIATDECSAADTVDYCVEVIADPQCGPCPTVTIEKTHNAFQGHFNTVTVSVDNLAYEIGGFDVLVKYDPSALVFSHAEPGQMILDCGWEYFTYRYGSNGNCANSACPSGIVRVNAIAETNNGPNHPGCFGMTTGDMTYLTFLVTDDRTFECQFVPIRFVWFDCGDNSFSNRDGDTLYISSEVYDFDNPNPITDLNSPFPSLFGANVTCNVALGDNKPDPIRCIEFVNGGIDIVCADSIDARGDINLNDIPYEIADAVLFSNYFVHGLAVFDRNVEGQIAATDVNADGISLSVADLVYLVRVIVGDALPYAKLSPSSTSYTYDGERLAVADEMGAAFITVQGSQTPLLFADNMEMLFNYDATSDITRILVYSMERGQTFSGEFLSVSGTLTSAEFATYDGAMVDAKLIPNRFALHQNHPNPFNPSTTISFELGRQSNYELMIYNISGQRVASFSGQHGAGLIEIQWNAQDIASGIYFYKLQAGDFVAVKKMIMLK